MLYMPGTCMGHVSRCCHIEFGFTYLLWHYNKLGTPADFEREHRKVGEGRKVGKNKKKEKMNKYLNTPNFSPSQEQNGGRFMSMVKIVIHIILYLKGSQLGAFCPYAIVYCYVEFKLSYLKNLKLLSIRIKESYEPIV